jgi:threonine/homoserine/homoserine lactone efflux protein
VLSRAPPVRSGGTAEFAYALAFGIVLGFSLTIPPGPMNALIAARSVVSLRAGILTGFGAMSADLLLGVAVYALRSEVDLGSVVRYVYAIGAAVMVYLAYRLARAPSPPAAAPSEGVRTYSQAVLVGVSNPFQIVWWLTAGLAFAYLGGLVLFVGLFAAILVWILAFPYALHLGTRGRPGLSRAIVYVSAGIMVGFAVYFAVLAA